ncbi:MAG: cysteine--tRNA ligase [Pseudomonadota bacterium]
MTQITKWPGVDGVIGNTPLVELPRINPNPKVRLLAKLEMRNPGGSVKDRIALSMIDAAERSGELTHAKTILEATSGNTGIGLALVAAARGYRILLAMSEGASIERRKILAALGAEFLLTPAEKGTDGAIEVAYELAAKESDRYFMTDQFNNPANVMAHYNGTAMEIWEQTGGAITHFVATMGTTGTLMGSSKRLHELNPAVRVTGIEPYLGHRIQGLKNMKEAYKPGIYDRAQLDVKVNVEDEAAYEMARAAARKEGLMVGMSSGAALVAAVDLIRTLDEGLVVVILPDGGERYLSTTLFQVPGEADKEEEKPAGLRFFNTLSHRYEAFEPARKDEVKIYSCGPTVDGPIHMGGCRRLVAADLLRRWLEFRGWKVRHVMNITDLDDRTIREAEKRGVPMKELTSDMEKLFLEDVDMLGVRRASEYPRASEHVEDMIALTEKLVKGGKAYEKLRSVYFDISSKEDYGKLSGFDLGKIKPGATIDFDSYEKDNPSDFTLLKRSTLGELKKGLSYKSSWGNVRPGWHIECAAMAMKYLGAQFDIHTSGVDLIFPHHENEIAICESISGHPPARFWLHSELVLFEGKKMSRTTGTALSLRDVMDRGYSARTVRTYLMSVHYRQPLHFSFAGLDAVKTSLERIDGLVRRLEEISAQESGDPAGPGHESAFKSGMEELRQSFSEAMDDDLNISAALASVFNFIRKANRLADRSGISAGMAAQALAVFSGIDEVLGIMTAGGEQPGRQETSEIEELVRKREEARAARQWQEADALRDRLLLKGVIVEDTPGGPRWRRRM